MKTVFSSIEYKRSRVSYAVQCTLEHLIGLLVADAFLAKLLTYIGLSDSLVGIVTSFSTVAFLFQLLSIKLVQSRFSTKKIVIFFDVISQAFFMLLYFVPFVPLQTVDKKLFVTVAIMIGQATKCLISTLYFKWANTYVSPRRRAIFSAKKECISLICGIVFSLVMGWIIDKFESIANLKGAFLFIGVSMLAINIANFISLLLIKDENPQARSEMRVPIKEILAHFLENKIYLNYVITGCIRSFGTGMVLGFLGVYKTKDLAFSILTLQVVEILADFTRMAVSQPFARLSQRIGYVKGGELAAVITVFAYLSVVFTTPETRGLIIVYAFLHKVSLAGSYQNNFNARYVLLPEKYMTQASAISQSVTGLCSLGAAVVAGGILEHIQNNGNTFLGISIYGQQFLGIITVILLLLSIVLRYNLVVKPLDIKNKEKL